VPSERFLSARKNNKIFVIISQLLVDNHKASGNFRSSFSSSAFIIMLSGLFPVRINFWNYGYYRELIVLLGWVISPVARPLYAQDNTHTEETQKDIHA
jgi:hypothetical protein